MTLISKSTLGLKELFNQFLRLIFIKIFIPKKGLINNQVVL
jgi:hypothetical protein